ncbi:hypothetical protein Ahy_A04g017693 [Arachis hypogaea]|uniref:Uncharacterized protein n=1 Tax=Arachis hypogaea TaxID=3818 RepID=A0A445DBT6_ARAHY|nr:hypothetical protein Ahy_A04g017693 [Arachis hypogaea]
MKMKALLRFKQMFIIIILNLTAAWNRTTYCCSSWHGIYNLVTGHPADQLYGSMDANSTFFSLSSSFRQYENTFSLEVPPQVSHLANLLSLDLLSSMLYDGPIINNLQLEASTLKSLTQNSTRL